MTYAELNTELDKKERAIERAWEMDMYNDETEMWIHLAKVRQEFDRDVQWLNITTTAAAA